MKKNAFYTITVLLFVMVFIFTSCDNIKESEIDVSDLDVELAQDDAIAEDVYNTVDAMVEDEVVALDENNYSTSLSLKSTSDDEPFVCKVVTIDHPNDSTFFPKIITIDYGEGCTIEINGEQYTRKGIIQIEITGRRCEVGATRTTSFMGFYINEINIQGIYTVASFGKNEAGNMESQHQLTDGKLVFSDTLQYSRNSTTIHERVRAERRMYDSIFVTGEGDGINTDGVAYQFQITEKLILIRCAEYPYQWAIVDGMVEVTREGEISTIDYGNGSCDNEINVIIDGIRKEIKQRYRYHHRRRLSGN